MISALHEKGRGREREGGGGGRQDSTMYKKVGQGNESMDGQPGLNIKALYCQRLPGQLSTLIK